MKSAWRFAIAALTAGLLLSPAAALAQAAPAPNTNTPATDTVGPAELQNFSLKGTVTRPAEQTPAPTPARPQTAPARPPALTSSSSHPPQTRTVQRSASAASSPAPKVATPAPTPAPQPNVQPPVQSAPGLSASTSQAAPTFALPVAPPAAEPLEPSRKLPLWPWIAAALAVLLAGGFLLWRRWPRELAANGPQFDLLVHPRPEPEPQPQPQPRPQPQPQPLQRAPAPVAPAPAARPAAKSGVVASRLRPALELAFHPLRCQVNDDQVAIEFELELFNAGAAPARAVLAEASMLNAGVTQEHDLAAFFANPNGVGDRLEVIPPMKRVSFRSQVVAPRAAVQEYELAGRKAFVPVIAFNALYEWSGGKGQSSAAYLVGRDTQKDKLGPLRLDQGAREFRGLGARPLPSGVRT